MDTRERGRRVFNRRKELGLTQEQLGDLAGISRNYVSLIERGEAVNITIKVIEQLAKHLGISPTELTGEATNQSMVTIPPSLRKFALENDLSFEVIDKLARIPRRGREPQTAKDWEDLYEAIRPYLNGDY